MPLRAESSHEPLHDGSLASLAPGGKLLIVALRTIRFAVLLVKTVGTKVLAAQSAEEMLWMPGLVESSHATLEEGGRSSSYNTSQQSLTSRIGPLQ